MKTESLTMKLYYRQVMRRCIAWIIAFETEIDQEWIFDRLHVSGMHPNFELSVKPELDDVLHQHGVCYKSPSWGKPYIRALRENFGDGCHV